MALRPVAEHAGGPGPRVLLADDYAPIRIGIRAFLEGAGFTVCAEAEDADGAVDAALAARPDVCVLDLKMPGDGLAAAARLADELPGTPVVILTASHDERVLLRALGLGAAGIVFKETDPTRLVNALRSATCGDVVLPRELVAAIARRQGRGEPLSDREWEVVELLKEGLPTAEIARRLYVEQVTVRSHVASILRKLGVRDRDSALRLLAGDDPRRVDDVQRAR